MNAKWRAKWDKQSHYISLITCFSAFTLLELLVVIAIMGILVALAVPAIKNLGRSNTTVSATRQLLDDIGRARQLAMSRRATVYMVFVPTNFWTRTTSSGSTFLDWQRISGTAAQRAAATNLIPMQLRGYAFVAYGAVGDQPGRHQWHYLSHWQTLPDGTFIAAQKFQPNGLFTINGWRTDYGAQIDDWKNPPPNPNNQIYGFTNLPIAFPTEDSTNMLSLPCIVFDSFGKLVSETADIQNGPYHHAYIPLVQGSVSYSVDPSTKAPFIPDVTQQVLPGDITENPAGNSGIGNNNPSYNVIDVDPLTGRPTLQFHKMP